MGPHGKKNMTARVTVSGDLPRRLASFTQALIVMSRTTSRQKPKTTPNRVRKKLSIFAPASKISHGRGVRLREALELGLVGGADDGPIEFAGGAVEAGARELAGEGWIVAELRDAGGELVLGVFVKEEAVDAVSDDAGDAAGAGGDGGEAGGVGFAEDAAHGFDVAEAGAGIDVLAAGEEELIGGPVVFVEAVVGDSSGEGDGVGDAEGVGEVLGRGGFAAVADDEEMGVWHGGKERGQGAEKQAEALLGDQAAGGHQEVAGRGEVETGSDCRLGFAGRTEAGGINTTG